MKRTLISTAALLTMATIMSKTALAAAPAATMTAPDDDDETPGPRSLSVAGCAASDLLCAAVERPFTNPLPIPPTYTPHKNPQYPGADYYEVRVTKFRQWFGLYEPGTSRRVYSTVWGYGQVGHHYDTGVRDGWGRPILQTGSYIAPTFLATRGRPVVVKWSNDLRHRNGAPLTHHLFESAYDTTIDGAEECTPHVRIVTHLHGGENAPASDGAPDAWLTPGSSVVDTYPNQQLPTALWYHDHAMGITRLNVMAMGAGLYVLRNPAEEASLNLPSGAHEIPLAIADRTFAPDGSLTYLSSINSPATPHHPRWSPEFFGNVITVNGMAWPYLEVEPRRYRFRILNASNARGYNLRLVDAHTGQPWPKVWQVGSDGGYLDAPVPLTMTALNVSEPADQARRLLLLPGERADVVVDLAGLPPGTTLTFMNDAPAPFPMGDAPEPGATDRILQLRVVPATAPETSALPAQLNPLPTRLDASRATVVRRLAITELDDPTSGKPVLGLLDNTCFGESVTERPRVGATEIWEIANTTPDTHPIHLHLVEFNLLDRQAFDASRYLADWSAATPGSTGLPTPRPTCPEMAYPPGVTTAPQALITTAPYVSGSRIGPAPTEAGWKDTVHVDAGTVTRLLVRFAPQDPGASGPFGGYSFDPTRGQYVWHCHMLEHEDNGMMRPLELQRAAGGP